MEVKNLLSTERLVLVPLSVNECTFILELVNTDGWIKFIGNRNINSIEESTAYIQKIIDNPNTIYWVVKLKDGQISIGIITFIKRDYFEHHDIGFAFLPDFVNHGFAHESSKKVLDTIMQIDKHSNILATTVPENMSSINLLKKLGFSFLKELDIDKVKLHVYEVLTNLDNPKK